MSVLSTATDRLVDLLPRLSRTSSIVDEAARVGQYPSKSLVDSVRSQAEELQGVAIDLVASGQGKIGRTLATDALNHSRRGGIMHAMNEHQNWFSGEWSGAIQGTVNHVTDAVRQLT